MAWDLYHVDVKTYRDHFIAHLDDDDKMIPPRLRVALDSTVLFYQHLVANAPAGAIVGRLPRDLQTYYDDCRALAATYHASYDAPGEPAA